MEIDGIFTDKSRKKNPLTQLHISQLLPQALLDKLESMQVLESVTSTNDKVMQCRPAKPGQFIVCVANQQSAGRGRNGQVWQSPPDANVYVSLGLLIDSTTAIELAGISLACGVALARVFRQLGVNTGLKWPNDVLYKSKKLAGVLVETRVSAKQIYVVVGVGVNVQMPQSSGRCIDQPWTDLHTALCINEYSDMSLNRNLLVSQLLASLMDCMQEYVQSGFESFAGDWEKFDMLTGRDVIIKIENTEKSGRVMGVNKDYSLNIEVDNQLVEFYAADIKLKVVENSGTC